jgi:HNH endonuclease
MAKSANAEIWKKVKIDLPSENYGHIEVSNLGNVRAFNRQSKGNLLKGSIINGIKIIRINFYKDRDEKLQAKLDKQKATIAKQATAIKAMIAKKEKKAVIAEAQKELNKAKANVKEQVNADLAARKMQFNGLVHRMVAASFLPKPKANQTVVKHINGNKLDNKVSNLEWITMEQSNAKPVAKPKKK